MNYSHGIAIERKMFVKFFLLLALVAWFGKTTQLRDVKMIIFIHFVPQEQQMLSLKDVTVTETPEGHLKQNAELLHDSDHNHL